MDPQKVMQAVTQLTTDVVGTNAKIATLEGTLQQINATLGGFAPLLQQLQQQQQVPQGLLAPQAPAPAMQAITLSPAQLQQLLQQPSAVTSMLPPNGVAHVPSPENPARHIFHSHAGATNALAGAMAAPLQQAGIPSDVATLVAVQQARQAVQALSSAGTFVMPEAPKGFEWKWYHVMGVGLLAALVGVGGVIAYQKWFKPVTK